VFVVPDFEKMKDEEIALLASDGQENATDYLLSKYRSVVLAKARKYFLIGADKEDIIQEGMIGLFKAVRDYKTENETSFSTFANLCITRQILTAVKSATRKKHIPLNTYISLDKTINDEENETTLIETLIDEFEQSPEDIVINKEIFSKTEKIIFSILSKFETQVLMKYLEGKSYSDIAVILNKSEKSIDNALQRIKKKIEKYITI
jgi:RNA polymerase sporulation-specific sigma factor